ncbi:MAG TPA: hypothetical protein VN761_07290 [Candidatus Polarisedimenticolia bacterium]|nr:hypothetical protein [Candidatus Polarisedimenticolia bacterium]
MENQTTFDLNHAIQRWRENLAQSPVFERENLNELESHLRDSITTLQSRGLSAEEAFMVATKRIGKSDALEKEFGKVNGRAVWLDRLLWILLGFQAWSLISNLSRLATGVVSPLGLQLNDMLPGFGLHKLGEGLLRNTVSIIFSPLVTTIAFSILAWYFARTKQGVLDFIQASLKRPLTLACCLFLACAVFRITATLVFRYWYLPTVFHIREHYPTTTLILIPFSDAILAVLTVLVARLQAAAA